VGERGRRSREKRRRRRSREKRRRRRRWGSRILQVDLYINFVCVCHYCSP